MKRILSAMLAAMMVITLAGCNNDTTESELREEIDRLQDEIDDLENEYDANDNANDDSDANTDNSTIINDTDTVDIETTTDAVVETDEPEVVCVRVDEAFRFEEIEGGMKMMGTNEDYRNDSINHIIFPAVIDGQPVIEVAYINWPDQIITVEFEEGYTRIPDYVLQLSNKLETVIIPDTVTEIGYAAFNMCESLVTVNIPDNIKFIDETAFAGSENIEATYRGKTYTYDMLPQLCADVAANNAE